MNRKYMEREEFKERQNRFEFFCAQAFEFVKEFANDCRKGWKALFSTKNTFENKTLMLPFSQLTHREWQEKATQVYLKLVNS